MIVSWLQSETIIEKASIRWHGKSGTAPLIVAHIDKPQAGEKRQFRKKALRLDLHAIDGWMPVNGRVLGRDPSLA